jgi:hypothetical protein
MAQCGFVSFAIEPWFRVPTHGISDEKARDFLKPRPYDLPCVHIRK